MTAPDREQALGGWQTIDTAPRDGTNIIAYDDGAITVLFWDEDRADWFHPYKGGKTRWSDVTHWMKLPADPESAPPNTASTDEQVGG